MPRQNQGDPNLGPGIVTRASRQPEGLAAVLCATPYIQTAINAIKLHVIGCAHRADGRSIG